MRKSTFVLFILVTLVAAQAFAGVYFKSVTKTEGAQGEMGDSTVKGWMSGDTGKVEFIESGSPITEAGSYLITKDGGKTVYLVNPKEKSYMKWDMESMMGMAGGAMKMMNMKFSEPKVEKLGEDNGGLVAGLPTTHYKVRTSYSMEMKFMGMRKSSAIVTEEDIWSTSELVEAALGMWFKKNPPKTGDAQLDSLIAKQMDTVKGFPLKRITVTTSTDEKGKSQVTKTVMEVKELQAMPVPASTFEIPAGYKETQMFPAGEEGGEGAGENPFAKILGSKKKP